MIFMLQSQPARHLRFGSLGLKFTLNKLGGFGRGYAVSQLDEAESDVLADRGTGDKGETNRRVLALDGKRHELMSHDFDGFEQVQVVLFVDGPGGCTPDKCFEACNCILTEARALALFGLSLMGLGYPMVR